MDLWDAIAREFVIGFQDSAHVVRVMVRMMLAMFLGGVIGLERQYDGKRAGVRTHMLVSLGAALFTLVAVESRMSAGDLSRVIQGVAAGVGFLGAGAILKQSDQGQVRGLNSAATIWVTAAVGMAVGGGWFWPAALSVVLACLVLSAVRQVEEWVSQHSRHPPAADKKALEERPPPKARDDDSQG